MSRLTAFGQDDEVLTAPAKLTLSLRIIGLRDDGYHLIDAEMVSLDLSDTLVVKPGRGIIFEGAGEMPDPEENLISKALELTGRTAHVLAKKAIPAGSGLGGGSSDAAAILRWAGFDDLKTAASLGADVPFCLRCGRARVSGAGEIVEPLEYQPRTYTLSIPPFSCSTADVYAAWDELDGPRGRYGNDLEPAALRVEPRLARVRDELKSATAQQPRLAGSGSTWFVEGAYPGEGRIVTRSTPPLLHPAPPAWVKAEL